LLLYTCLFKVPKLEKFTRYRSQNLIRIWTGRFCCHF